MLFHITSLPATRSCCGQFLDPQTDDFVNFLVKSKQTHWIMNPLFALGNDLCPYNASGRFSKNKYLVNLNQLTTEKYGKLLKEKELPDDVTAPVFTMDMLKTQKNPRFDKAFARFSALDEAHPLKQEFKTFENKNKDLWLDTCASYHAISSMFGDNWKTWPKAFQTLPEDAKEKGLPLKTLMNRTIDKASAKNVLKQFEQFKFEQFLYDKQFNEFKSQLQSKDIRLILDLAIGVNPNGVDVWANKNIFLLDEDYAPTKISGAPPEGAYPYTQTWGHALYNYDSPDFWNYQESSIRRFLNEGDLRLDHFVGYINRVEIPTKYETKDGKVLEDFGPLGETKAYKEFKQKFAADFVSQRIPIALGIGESIKSSQDITNSSHPDNLKAQENIALLTGNHDLMPIKEYIDKLLDAPAKHFSQGDNSPALFRKFCKEELKLKTLKDRDLVARELMKWHYLQQNTKQVQTTLQDALGIYFRPNIPGSWNGMKDKYEMKNTPEALLPFWSRVFPKDFLNNSNKSGINPGYRDLAENYIKMMEEIFPE